jgi:signal transduction histidine kinase
MRINLVALGGATLVLAVVYGVGARLFAIWADLVTMVVALGWLLASIPMARRFGERGAIFGIACSTFTFAVGGTWVTPTLLPLTVMLTVVPLLVGYPHVSRRWLRGLMAYAFLGSTGLCVLAEWQRSTSVSSTWWVNAIIAAASLPSVLLVVLYLVRDIYNRLQLQSDQLRESRTRVVEVADAARRAIERDLHDGAQQRLLAMSVSIGMARRAVAEGDLEAADELLRALGQENQDVLTELRELARGIYPPLLAERGLLVALQSAARRSALQVTLRAEEFDRVPQEIENAAYFCILEAMTNAAKHGAVDEVLVRLTRGRDLVFEVIDQGVGFDTGTSRVGGLLGMDARVTAVGGRLEVGSAPGRGTTVRGTFPLPGDGHERPRARFGTGRVVPGWATVARITSGPSD